jgi:hypothetical protein
VKAAVNPQVLPPQGDPLVGPKDFSEGDPKPVDQPRFTPAASDPLDLFDRSAESRFHNIHCQRNAALMSHPVIEEGKGSVREVPHIRPRSLIFGFSQRRQNFSEAPPDRPDPRFILGAQRFHVGLTQL